MKKQILSILLCLGLFSFNTQIFAAKTVGQIKAEIAELTAQAGQLGQKTWSTKKKVMVGAVIAAAAAYSALAYKNGSFNPMDFLKSTPQNGICYNPRPENLIKGLKNGEDWSADLTKGFCRKPAESVCYNPRPENLIKGLENGADWSASTLPVDDMSTTPRWIDFKALRLLGGLYSIIGIFGCGAYKLAIYRLTH